MKAGLRMDCWEETPKASAPARHATTERAVKRMVAIHVGRQVRTGGRNLSLPEPIDRPPRADIIERINSIEKRK